MTYILYDACINKYFKNRNLTKSYDVYLNITLLIFYLSSFLPLSVVKILMYKLFNNKSLAKRSSVHLNITLLISHLSSSPLLHSLFLL